VILLASQAGLLHGISYVADVPTVTQSTVHLVSCLEGAFI
jgi:hypothetical protein